jgi:hypothetical protein
MRRSFYLAVGILALATACAPTGRPLAVSERARYVSELIDDSAPCEQFKARLAAPAMDAGSVGTIYGEAKAGGCIKKDV